MMIFPNLLGTRRSNVFMVDHTVATASTSNQQFGKRQALGNYSALLFSKQKQTNKLIIWSSLMFPNCLTTITQLLQTWLSTILKIGN